MTRRQHPPLTDGAFWVARRSGIRPLQERIREEAGDLFITAGGWLELEETLALLGYRLEPGSHPGGVVVTDGRWHASLSRVAWGLSGPRLAERFGESFAQHRQQHPLPPPIELWAAERARPSALQERRE
jgi:hypothetical protein